MKRIVSQGTISWLVGCHSPIHSILVVLAWRKLYGSFPAFWQIICIFIHDIGHLGLEYLDDYEQKKIHWSLGAKLAGKLFGQKGYDFVAGHCSTSDTPKNPLYKADKYSYMLAPIWWLYWNNLVEPKLMEGSEGNLDSIRKFRASVRQNVESGKYRSTHQLYLDRVSSAGQKP